MTWPPGFDAFQHLLDIARAVGRGGQEMKHRTVVPDVIARGRQLGPGDVGGDPLHRLRARAEPRAAGCQRRFGEVEHGQIAITGIEQIVHQHRRAAADVDDVRILVREPFDQAQR